MPVPGRFQTINPATGEPGQAWDGHTPDEAAAILGQTHAAFEGWRRTECAERARLMHAAARVLRELLLVNALRRDDGNLLAG